MSGLTAIILCRSSSKRLKLKHFKKIGKISLIEIIIKQLLDLNIINEIYIATGPKSKNYIYEKFLKKKYKSKVKFFYYSKENYVNERIFNLSKKIKNKYTMIYSGDCPLVDKKYISKLYNFFLKNNNFDYAYLKDAIVEGIDIFKTSLWRKINENSYSSNELVEFPAYVIKKKPNLFKKKILSKVDFENYILKKKHLRLSIDTQSDLDFFRLFYSKVNDYEKFNYSEVYKYQYLKFYNKHVVQKKIAQDIKNKIIIISHKSKKYGYGHFSRSQTVAREINETITSSIKKIILKNQNLSSLDIFLSKFKLKNFKNKIVILDIPKIFLLKIINILAENNKIILIDNIFKHKNVINIIPSLRKPSNTNVKYFYGTSSLILKRDINLYRFVPKIEKKNILIFPGSTGLVPRNLLNSCIALKKYKFIVITSNKKIKNSYSEFKNISFKSLTNNPSELLKITNNSLAVIARHGVYTYECIALQKKLFIWTYGETGERLKDIKYLAQKRYAKIFNPNNLEKEMCSKNFKKIQLFCGCYDLINQINQLLNIQKNIEPTKKL